MNFTPEQVDLIVQRVLEHLNAAAARPSSAIVTTASTKPAARSEAVRIEAQVVTQAVLAGSVNGHARVSIGAKAILTPSARDFVRARGIEVVRESSSRATKPALRWQVIVSKTTPQLASALHALKQSRGDTTLSGQPAEAAALAISALCRGEAERVVVFSDQPELAACLANRNDRVRAAAVADEVSVERVRKSLPANLLAIDPSGKGVHELKSLLKAFVEA